MPQLLTVTFYFGNFLEYLWLDLIKKLKCNNRNLKFIYKTMCHKTNSVIVDQMKEM